MVPRARYAIIHIRVAPSRAIGPVGLLPVGLHKMRKVLGFARNGRMTRRENRIVSCHGVPGEGGRNRYRRLAAVACEGDPSFRVLAAED